MRHVTCIIVAAGVLAAGLGARVLGAGPATQPGAGKVLLLPFEQSGPGPWHLGQAIRQAVLADLMPYAPGRVQPLDAPAGDDKSAIEAARKAGAAYVVIGNVVAIGRAVRFDGRVLNVDTGRAIAPLKATGPADNLYAMETALADELGRAIGLAMPPAAPLAPAPLAHQANPWETNVNAAANPYAAEGAVIAGGAVEPGGSDFGPLGYGGYGFGGYGYGPYLGPGFVVPGGRHHHGYRWGRGGFDETDFGGLGVPSIAGGGGYPALDGGEPYGLFIPTNGAEAREFNRYGGLGTVDITRPARVGGFARHAAGGHAAGVRRR